ncbi:hypothetical protein [Methanoregula sp.]|uniref:hypothetical protein n=1 Tax=Methanoregula sp. TaxID=2052170 RepID=UPI002629D221|nr:hypothetical protein [Methanoregula sp.]MDD5143500.1 hypothetical protein [Methanoregula sp.]
MPPPGLDVKILNQVFQLIHNETNHGTANHLTRKKLQTSAGQIPPESVLGCLVTYQGDNLIQCSKDKVDFPPKDQMKDYDEFHLTSRGIKSDSPYMYAKDKYGNEDQSLIVLRI